MTEPFRLRRRTESYDLNDVQKWLTKHPTNSLTIEYAKGGYVFDTERSRPWKLNVHGPRAGFRPGGYITETLHEAIELLFDEDRK